MTRMNDVIPVSLVPFHSDLIYAAQANGGQWIAMRPVCQNLGLEWGSQYNRIQRDPILSTCVFIMKTQIPGDDQARPVLFLPFEFFHGWLFGISVNAVKPELRDRLIRYQRECYRVLADHFGKRERSQREQAETENATLKAALFRQYPRLPRILEVINYDWPRAEIAQDLGVCPATLARDLARLREYGLLTPALEARWRREARVYARIVRKSFAERSQAENFHLVRRGGRLH